MRLQHQCKNDIKARQYCGILESQINILESIELIYLSKINLMKNIKNLVMLFIIIKSHLINIDHISVFNIKIPPLILRRKSTNSNLFPNFKSGFLKFHYFV